VAVQEPTTKSRYICRDHMREAVQHREAFPMSLWTHTEGDGLSCHSKDSSNRPSSAKFSLSQSLFSPSRDERPVVPLRTHPLHSTLAASKKTATFKSKSATMGLDGRNDKSPEKRDLKNTKCKCAKPKHTDGCGNVWSTVRIWA